MNDKDTTFIWNNNPKSILDGSQQGFEGETGYGPYPLGYASDPVLKYETLDPEFKRLNRILPKVNDNLSLISNNTAQREAQQWLYNWYSNPTTVEIVKQNGRFPSFIETQFVTTDNGSEYLITHSPKNIDTTDYRLARALGIPTYVNPEIESELNAVGAFISPFGGGGGSGYIEIDPKYVNDAPTWLHEFNHSVQNLLPIKPQNEPSEWEVPYSDRWSEQHSALMSIRRGFDLNPEKRDYTADDAHNMIVQMLNNKETLPTDVYDFIANYIQKGWTLAQIAEKLKTMLNTWASNDLNNSNQSESMVRAAKGTKLPSVSQIRNILTKKLK